MTSADLHLLLDYHYWARDRVLAAAERITVDQYTRDLGSSFPSVRDTLSHIYFADRVWYARWQGESPRGPAPEPFPDVPALRAAWQRLEAQYRTYLGGLGDAGLQRVLHYTLLSGASGTGVIWQMVQHVVNHASYHRGQVTTMLRQLGAEPPAAMDLMAFYREGEAAR